MALQYWRGRGLPDKRRLMTWRGGYHGDTFLAMSITDPHGGMHSRGPTSWRPSVRATSARD